LRESGVTREVSLDAGALSASTVQNVKTLPAPNQSVGYMQFNDHLATCWVRADVERAR